MLKLRFEIAFASLQAHPPEQSFDPVCCPLPPVCQPQPRMKRFAGKHILVLSLLSAGQGLRGKRPSPHGRAPPSPGSCQPLRGRAVLPSPVLPAVSTPAFCAPLGLKEAYPEGEDPGLGTLLREDPVSFYRVVWENLITRLEKTDACLPLVLPALPDSVLLF